MTQTVICEHGLYTSWWISLPSQSPRVSSSSRSSSYRSQMQQQDKVVAAELHTCDPLDSHNYVRATPADQACIASLHKKERRTFWSRYTSAHLCCCARAVKVTSVCLYWCKPAKPCNMAQAGLQRLGATTVPHEQLTKPGLQQEDSPSLLEGSTGERGQCPEQKSRCEKWRHMFTVGAGEQRCLHLTA